ETFTDANLLRPASGKPDVPDLPAGTDFQLVENAAQVGLDRARTQEQLGTDLAVGRPRGNQAGDMQFLGGECVGGLDGAFARFLTGGAQLVGGTFGVGLRSHVREHAMRGPELLAGILATALAAQPFAVDEMGAGE